MTALLWEIFAFYDASLTVGITFVTIYIYKIYEIGLLLVDE